MSKVIKFKTSPVEDYPDDLIKIGEFAKKYKVDRSYPYKLRDRGKLTLYKLGCFKLSESEGLKAIGN
mgnify:CR=1 FL=1